MPANSQSLLLFKQQDFMGSSPGPFKIIVFPEVPTFISVTDATDDGYADILATLPSSDLLFLYKQESGVLPDSPSMTFVTGALPNYALIGDANGDFRPDLIVSDSGSRCLSVWHQVNFPPVALAGGPYQGTEGVSVFLAGSETREISEIPNTLYRWTFGDGEVGEWTGSPLASHIYASEGDYMHSSKSRTP